MRNVFLILIKLLKFVAVIGLLAGFTIFINSILKGDSDAVVIAILLFSISGGLYWFFDKLNINTESGGFNSYLKQAIKNKSEGNDLGKELLLSNAKDELKIQKSIQEEKPWVIKLNIASNHMGVLGIEITKLMQIVHIKTIYDKNLSIIVNDVQLAQIIAHLLSYHDKNILSDISEI